MQLHGMRMSGNCWKAAQILKLTGHQFEWVETDGNAGATRTPEFLAINPIGKVPALVLDDGVVLTESNAILLHYGEGTSWLPSPGLARTRVHEWLFFEQYRHEPYIAVARNLVACRMASLPDITPLPRPEGFAAPGTQSAATGSPREPVGTGR